MNSFCKCKVFLFSCILFNIQQRLPRTMFGASALFSYRVNLRNRFVLCGSEGMSKSEFLSENIFSHLKNVSRASLGFVRGRVLVVTSRRRHPGKLITPPSKKTVTCPKRISKSFISMSKIQPLIADTSELGETVSKSVIALRVPQNLTAPLDFSLDLNGDGNEVGHKTPLLPFFLFFFFLWA